MIKIVILGNGQRKHIHSYLGDFLFTSDQLNRPVSTLSGGEKNRLQLAMFMRQAADLWVFDEPTNDLDIETIELLEKELKEYDAAVIIIGHDRAFLDNICKSTWLIHEKQVEIFEGGYTQVAPYLHALEMEKSIPQKVVEKKQEQSKPRKLSYKEKERLKVIESEIEKAEMKVAEIEELLVNFDFTDMNAEKQSEYDSLNQKKLDAEGKVESLFEEWEKLSAISKLSDS